MIIRRNILCGLAVKKGIAISKYKGNISAILMMSKAGVPKDVIHRVLLKPHKVRSSDST